MNVKNLMNRNPETISPSTSLKTAAALMAEKNIGFLLVGADNELKGTLTDRDIVQRAVAKGKNMDQTTVQDALTGTVLYCNADEDINEVARNMSEQKVRRLPVVDNNKRLVGIVSIGDMAQHIDQDKVGKVLQGVTSDDQRAAWDRAW
jgi:CBS domain-containing protein